VYGDAAIRLDFLAAACIRKRHSGSHALGIFSLRADRNTKAFLRVRIRCAPEFQGVQSFVPTKVAINTNC
jgi:hypothetical protein